MMNLANSLLQDLVTEHPDLRPQIYFKSSMIALARALQDLILGDSSQYLVIANFQYEKYFRQQKRRFQEMAAQGNQVYIMGVPEQESGFSEKDSGYETIPLCATDTLARERYFVIIGLQYSACLVVQDKILAREQVETNLAEQEEIFEGFWTFERNVAYDAADWLLGQINNYRPELKEKTNRARKLFKLHRNRLRQAALTSQSVDLGNFTQRLLTYLQAGQYKLVRAYKALAKAQQKDLLVNKISAAQRSSLNPEEILSTTVQELGQLFPHCRCLLYCLNSDSEEIQIKYEFSPLSMTSLIGQKWSIADNPLFIAAQAQKSTLVFENVVNNDYLTSNPILKEKITRAGIRAWLMVAIRYQGKLLGMMELHYGGSENLKWEPEDLDLIEAVATSAGAALTQGDAYAYLLKLNNQLEAVEKIQNNLIAIVGHELRTPLSTILVCLESLSSEPDMPLEFRNTMLNTALADTERLRQLIQNFLTLSKLEAGKAYRNIESLTVDYAINLALARINKTAPTNQIPEIKVELPHNLPSILADIDGLVEVFDKLLDNAIKFTPADGQILISARVTSEAHGMLEVVVTDTGRGINSQILETIFDRFSQSESYLRRTVSGVGLGLVICRQVIRSMGGRIWAKSKGENRGSEFHFTLNIESPVGIAEQKQSLIS